MKVGLRRQALLSAVPPILLFAVPAALFLAWGRTHLHGLEYGMLVALGVFGAWRYSWQALNYLRAFHYARHHYPRLREHADNVSTQRGWPQRVFVVVASYHEEPWVTVESFQSLMTNVGDLPCRVTLVVAVGGEDDEALIASVCRAHPARAQVELVFQHQSQGKRVALGHALRAVARRYRDEPDSVTFMMDGDTWLEPATMARCVPFFLAYRDLGAVTTNEVAFIPGASAWHRDWFALKFGQRHVLFQSHSLSHKVLTLTGRFSVLRTAIAVQEDFICMIERDSVDHWLHGRMRFLMGDDKSSWFWLLRGGWNMLYLPDVTVCSLESRQVGFFDASVSLPYRWFGNTLRNNPRALALGPARVGGVFIWLALLDQRISMWTSLVGLTGALALAALKSLLYLPLYLAWALVVRAFQLVVITAHGHAVSLRTIPIMLYTQWVGALVKIHAWHHLGEQNWSKGRKRQVNEVRGFGRIVPRVVMVLSYLTFGVVVLLAHSLLRWPSVQLFAAETPVAAAAAVDASLHGVTADDGKDDAAALQALLERVGGRGPVTVKLPAGQLDLGSPVVLRHSDVAIVGAGAGATRLVSTVRAPAEAVVRVEGERGHVVATLSAALAEDVRELMLDKPVKLAPGELLLLRQPNDDALFRSLGSERWKREQPYLRQSLLRVLRSDGNRVEVEAAPGIAFEGGSTQVVRVRAVERTRLADFSIEQRVPGRAIDEVKFRYANEVPEYAVDAISLDWTADAVVERVVVRAAGRHPVSFEHSYGFALRECVLDGAWNKGDGGSGYLRIARSYHGSVEGCQVRNIRHIALQWSSAFNRLERVDSTVDVNFHGGYSHHNVAQDMRFAIPPAHKWPQVFVTPRDAAWAPPDGPGNRVTALAAPANTAPAVRAALPAR